MSCALLGVEGFVRPPDPRCVPGNISAPIRLQEGSPKPFQVNSCSHNPVYPVPAAPLTFEFLGKKPVSAAAHRPAAVNLSRA